MNHHSAPLSYLEELDHMGKMWEQEDQLVTQKQYPEGFPALPEIPVGRYIDPEFFEIEKQHLWRKTWILAGFMSDIPEHGSYKAFDFLGAPIVIVNAGDDGVSAFHNVCQHRGAKLCWEEKGKEPRFRCRYHSWTYDLTGKLIYVPLEHEFPGMDKSAKGLTPLRCERLGNLIFVSHNADAPPLDAFFGDIMDLMEDVPFDRAVLHKTVSWESESNWKCVHDAFNETYHLPFTHNTTAHQTLDSRRQVKYMFNGGHNAMILKARADSKASIYREADAGSRTMKPLTYVSSRAYNMFPNWTTPVYDGVFTIIEAVPLTVSRSILRVHFLKVPGADGLDIDALADEAVAAFTPVIAEDISQQSDMYACMAGGGLASIPLSYSEQFLYNYQQEIDRVIGIENIPENLRMVPVDLPIISRS